MIYQSLTTYQNLLHILKIYELRTYQGFEYISDKLDLRLPRVRTPPDFNTSKFQNTDKFECITLLSDLLCYFPFERLVLKYFTLYSPPFCHYQKEILSVKNL